MKGNISHSLQHVSVDENSVLLNSGCKRNQQQSSELVKSVGTADNILISKEL